MKRKNVKKAQFGVSQESKMIQKGMDHMSKLDLNDWEKLNAGVSLLSTAGSMTPLAPIAMPIRMISGAIGTGIDAYQAYGDFKEGNVKSGAYNTASGLLSAFGGYGAKWLPNTNKDELAGFIGGGLDIADITNFKDLVIKDTPSKKEKIAKKETGGLMKRKKAQKGTKILSETEIKSISLRQQAYNDSLKAHDLGRKLYADVYGKKEPKIFYNPYDRGTDPNVFNRDILSSTPALSTARELRKIEDKTGIKTNKFYSHYDDTQLDVYDDSYKLHFPAYKKPVYNPADHALNKLIPKKANLSNPTSSRKIEKKNQSSLPPTREDVVDFNYYPGVAMSHKDEKREAGYINYGDKSGRHSFTYEQLHVDPEIRQLVESYGHKIPKERYQDGGIVTDILGYWNPENWGKPVNIPSNEITMKGVSQPLLGVSNTGDTQMMFPNNEYKFNGENVVEFPISKDMKTKNKKGKVKKAQFGIGQSGAGSLVNQNNNMLPLSNEPISPFQQTSFLATPIEEPTSQSRDILGNLNASRRSSGAISQMPKIGTPLISSFMGEKAPTHQSIGQNTMEQQFGKPQPKKDGLSDALGSLPLIGGLAQGIMNIGKQNDELKRLEGTKDLATLNAKAANIIPKEEVRKYVRPEDTVVSGDELYPVNGVGTDILAKDGKKVPKAFLGSLMGMLGGGGSPTTPQGQEAGSQIGQSVGGLVGSIPMLSAFKPLLEGAGGFIGAAIDQSGEKKAALQSDINTQAGLATIGNNVRDFHQRYGGSMKNGGKMAYGGDLIVDNGSIQPISENPYSSGTMEFKGPSHDDGGVLANYGGNPVEVEGGETGYVEKMTPIDMSPTHQEIGRNGMLQQFGEPQEQLTIFGNLPITKESAAIIGDKRAAGKKFKTFGKMIANDERKANNIQKRSLDKLDETDERTTFGKLTMNSLLANDIGTRMKLKEAAVKKEKAGMLQEFYNATAEEQGLSAEYLAKGQIKQAKKGAVIPKAQIGASPKKIGEINFNNLPEVSDEDYNYLKGLYDVAEKQQTGEAVKKFQQEYHRLAPKFAQEIIDAYEMTNYGEKNKMSSKNLFTNEDGLFGDRTRQYIQLLGRKRKNIIPPAPKEAELIPPPNYNHIPPTPITLKETTVKKEEPKTKFPWQLVGDVISPFMKRKYREGLDWRQLAGEMAAMRDHEEPVYAQLFSPELDTPYDISFQDRLNENTATTRALSRGMGYNPAAMSTLASQNYAADSNVLAEQFRANQAQKDQVYSKNRDILNSAKLTNLGILDKQQERQAMAKSNTKANRQAALSSMASKYLQNEFENKQLGVLENLYPNFGFDRNMNALNQGFSFFGAPRVGSAPVEESGTDDKKVKEKRKGGIVKAIKHL